MLDAHGRQDGLIQFNGANITNEMNNLFRTHRGAFNSASEIRAFFLVFISRASRKFMTALHNRVQIATALNEEKILFDANGK